MTNKIIFLFCSGIDDVLSGSSQVAGIQVQMSFWARTFVKHGWSVISFTNYMPNEEFEGIKFVKKSRSKLFSLLHLEILREFLDCLRCVKLLPDLVFFRGSSRCLFLLARLCNRKHVWLVYFGASDTDFEPGKEIVGGSSLNRTLYQKSLRHIESFVTQNKLQHDLLAQYYKKRSLIIPNIWIPYESIRNTKQYDAVWIANLRPLKRAEWFVSLAKALPQYQFAIAGGCLICEYYDKIKRMANNVANLSFLGAQSFDEVNKLLSRSRLLVCTSEFEGFPNTFLQAWAQSVPLVSTVNPSNLIISKNLGVVVGTQEDLKEQVEAVLSNNLLYCDIVNSIEKYFLNTHSADMAFDLLTNYLSY